MNNVALILRDLTTRTRRCAGLRELTVEVGPAGMAFTGSWLVNPDAERVKKPAPYLWYGVAITARGQFAVYTATDDLALQNDLKVYRTLAEAASDGVPTEIIDKANLALSGMQLIRLDILGTVMNAHTGKAERLDVLTARGHLRAIDAFHRIALGKPFVLSTPESRQVDRSSWAPGVAASG